LDDKPKHESFAAGRASGSGERKKVSMPLPNKLSTIWAASILTAVLLASGCSRKSSETANSPANTQAAAEAAPAVQAGGQADMAELDRVARVWMFRNHRRPTSWEDFAANAGVQIPPPPPGKKYVLSKDMRITLVDQ